MSTIVVKVFDEDGVDFGVKRTGNTPHVKAEISDSSGKTADLITDPETGNTALLVTNENHICSDNTTIVPLLAGATFTGVWQDTLQFQEVNIAVSSDQDSASNGLVIQWSSDGITIHDTDLYNVYGGSGTNYTPNPSFQYVRLVYTNGAVDQTIFTLLTILRKNMTGGSFHRIDSTLKDDNDGRLTLAVPKLRTAQNTYVSQSATNLGNAKVSIEELDGTVSSNAGAQLNTTIFDSTGLELKLDQTTRSVCTTNYAHCEIHSGDHFYAKHWVDLANDATYDLLFVVPATTKLPHFEFLLEGEAEGDIILYSGTTTSSNGTPVLVANRNPGIGTANNALAFHTPTITSVGTAFAEYKFGSGKKAGGLVRANNEVVLEASTKYLMRIHNGTASNNWIDYLADWYEHTNL